MVITTQASAGKLGGEPPRAVVVGGGLAGLSAACELLERGCAVTILDKHTRLGGVSSKAVTGIAAPGSALQEKHGIKDNGEDLLALGEGPAAEDLIKNGAKDVDWFTQAVACEDELVLRLSPGHSKVKRTLGTNTHFPGMVVTYGAAEHLKRVADSKSDLLTIITSAQVTKLVTQEGSVKGVEYVKSGQAVKVMGKVILCTGGYAGDKTKTGVIGKNAATLKGYPTCCDDRSCGDGIDLGKAAGAKVEQLADVQINPLALVMPDAETDDWKMCLSSTFLGVGGVLVDGNGKKFCEELGPVQDIVDAMERNKGPFRMVLHQDKGVAGGMQWLLDFYESKKFAKKYNTPAALAKVMGVPQIDVEGKDPVYVFTVTPALYSCSGGIATNFADGRVSASGGQPIKGLFAAGETTSCAFKKLWSVAGIPMLWAIHSGRNAGAAAAKEAFAGKEPARATLQQLIMQSMAPMPDEMPDVAEAKKDDDKPLDTMSKEELIALAKKLKEGGAGVSGAAAPAADPGYTLDEVAKHNTKADAWVIINGDVCDVTKWIAVHPGGEQAIMAYVGKDATEEWNMIHKPGTVEKNAFPGKPDGPKVLGKVGGAAPVASTGGGGGGLTPADVAKHNTKEDAWVIVNGEAIDVTKWIPVHPGGVAAIMQYLGQDASTEWNGIHRPGTIEANESNPNGPVKMGKVVGGDAPAPVADPGYDTEWPDIDNGNGGCPTPLGAVYFLVKSILQQISKTAIPINWNGAEFKMEKAPCLPWITCKRETPEEIEAGCCHVPGTNCGEKLCNFILPVFKATLYRMSTTWQLKIDNNRNGTIRSACFLLLFTIGHSGGNALDIIAGPHSVNGEGYMFDRFHWMYNPMSGTWSRWEFSLVDIYLYLSVLLHVTVALKRSWDITMAYCVHTGRWNMMLSGLTVLLFLMHHLWDLQFFEYHGKWGQAKLRPPNLYIGGVAVPVNPAGMADIPPAVFFQKDTSVAEITVRDLYSREVDLFSNLSVVLFYTFSLLVFVYHMCFGWMKLVTADAFAIPKFHRKAVNIYGILAAIAVGAAYLSTPWVIFLSGPGGPHPEAYTDWAAVYAEGK